MVYFIPLSLCLTQLLPVTLQCIINIRQHCFRCCDTIDALNDAIRACRAANAFFIGDLNINLLCKNECKCLKDVMDIHGLCNLIESPTCFKSDNPSLIDVAQTEDS